MPETRDPIERAIRNQFDLQQLGNGLGEDTRARMERLFNQIAGAIARVDPTSARSVAAQRAKVQRLIAQLNDLIGTRLEDWRKAVRADLAEIGTQQALYARATLLDSLGGPSALRIAGIKLSDPKGLGVQFFKAIVDTNPFDGQVLREWAETQAMRTLVDVRREIQLGLGQNESVDQIVRRVRGKSDGRGGFVGGVLDKTTRETRAIVRTAINEVASTAQWETYRRETEITTTYTYVATLDGRTTLICAALDGQSFRYDDPKAPRPPMHWNCRSAIVPDIDWKALGLDAPPEGVRATQGGGKVKEATDYDAWLRGKSSAEQDRILGPERAKLFRGGVKLRDMVRDDTTVLTVAQLREAA